MARTKKKDTKPAKADKSVTAAKAPKRPAIAKAPKKLEKRKKKKNYESYSSFIFKVLRQIHESMGISRNTMIIMNDFMNDIFERLANEASSLARKNKSRTLSKRDIMAAVQLQIQGELATHAIAEGNKAVAAYEASIIRVKPAVETNAESNDESDGEGDEEDDEEGDGESGDESNDD